MDRLFLTCIVAGRTRAVYIGVTDDLETTAKKKRKPLFEDEEV